MACSQAVAAAVVCVLVIAFTVMDCGAAAANDRNCITGVDINTATISFSNANAGSSDREYKLLPNERTLPKSTLLAAFYFYRPNCSESSDPAEFLLVCDNSDADCKGRSFAAGNVSLASYVATSSVVLSTLGVMLYDVLTLGAMDVAERANVTGLALPAPVCPGKEDRVYADTIRLVSLQLATNASYTTALYSAKCL